MKSSRAGARNIVPNEDLESERILYVFQAFYQKLYGTAFVPISAQKGSTESDAFLIKMKDFN